MRDDHYYPKGKVRNSELSWGSLPNPSPGTNIDTVLANYATQEADRAKQEAASPTVSASFSHLPLDIGLLSQEFPAIDRDHPEAVDACVKHGHYFAGLVLELAYDQ